MRLSFIYPIALVLLLLLPLLWAFSLATRRATAQRLPPWRFWSLLVLRSIALASLALALAGTQLVRPVDNLTVVFLVDGSDSVAPAQREQALQYINTALANRQPDDQAAVVVFGRNALVERVPAPLDTVGRLTSAVQASRTNIAEAIQLGLALFPADAQKRLVLLSDGRENEGRAIEAARLAAARDIPLDIVTLPGVTGADAFVRGLDAPDIAREGQELRIQATIESSYASSARLQIFADNELIGTQELQLQEGTNSVPLVVPGGEAGFRRYEVRLEAQGDTQPLNNRAAAFTLIQGPPRVLLIASNPDYAAPLANALQAANARVEVLSPDQVTTLPTELQQYAAIVLVDVTAREVPRALQTALPIYVREQGGSLAMIGGTNSFGAGGWRRSPIAEILPVELDPPDRQQRPELALTLVIDRSGSMAESVAPGVTKLTLAKEAVYQASLGLERIDQIGVVAFDSTASWVLPLQQLPSLVEIEQALSSFGDGGGTDIRSGIAEAAQAMPAVDAKTKHVILLTDGIADSNYADLIDQMRNNQITITVVSIGTDANPELREIAERGGGRFYQVNQLSDVPRIFLAETVLVAGRDIVEETFTPVVALPAPLVRGLSGLPPLYGFNATEVRSAARTILVTPDGKPILAQWQYGLGRTIAWTSDFKGQWARDWIAWAEFPRFVAGLLDALLPPQQVEGLTLDAQADGPQAVLELTAQDGQGRSIEGAQVEGRLLDPENRSQSVRMTQVGPGRYRAVLPTDTPGVYLAQVAVSDANGQALGNALAGLVVSYSPEYSGTGSNAQTLSDLTQITGGRAEPAAASLFAETNQTVGIVEEIAIPLLWLALLLWPIDIALRRLLLRRSDLAPLAQRLRPAGQRQTPATPTPTIARLQNARARVQRRPAAGNSLRSTNSPTEPTAAPPASRPSAETSTAPANRPPQVQPPAPPAAPPRGDEVLANLLASRQRARRKGSSEPDKQ